MSEPVAPVPGITPYETVKPVQSRWSVLAIVAFVLAVVLTVALLSLKTLGAAWAFPQEGEDYGGAATALGTLLGLGLIPDLLTVVLAHIALGQTGEGKRRGRVLAAVALGAGYLHLLLWGNRIVNAAVAAAGVGDFAEFVPNLFWWA